MPACSAPVRHSDMPDPIDHKVVIKGIDMPDAWKQSAIDVASKAIDKCDQEKDIAGFIKKEFDNLHKGTWHCIVGRNFGCYLTHDEGSFIYFYLAKYAILLFKSA